MQYNVTCSKCNRTFTITADGNENLRCTCPYCGQSLLVNLPSLANPVTPSVQQPIATQDNKKDQGDKQDKNKDKGDDQKDPNQNNQQNKNQSGQGQGEQRPSSLSPQQMERILEAMNNEERKTQEKINAQKVKGQRAKTEKDW